MAFKLLRKLIEPMRGVVYLGELNPALEGRGFYPG